MSGKSTISLDRESHKLEFKKNVLKVNRIISPKDIIPSYAKTRGFDLHSS